MVVVMNIVRVVIVVVMMVVVVVVGNELSCNGGGVSGGMVEWCGCTPAGAVQINSYLTRWGMRAGWETD